MALLAHHQLCFCRRRPPPDARLQTTRRASRLYPHASAAADSPTATTAPFSFDALSQWCTARGAFIHSSLGVSDIPGAGRGFVATTPVAAGTVLARLPFSVCLYAARDPGEGDDSWSVTRQLAATALEFSRQAENAPVVAAWPRENCVGALSPDATLNELQYEPLRAEAGKLARRLRTSSSSEDEMWAMNVVATRRCSVLCAEQPPGRSGVTEVVVPIFDLANHSASPQLSFDWVGGALELTCVEEALAGQHLCICYGPGDGTPHAPDALFLTYGLVPSSSGDDSVLFWRDEFHLAGWLLELAGDADSLALDPRLSNDGIGWEGLASWESPTFDRSTWLCLSSTFAAGSDEVELVVDPRIAQVAAHLGVDEQQLFPLLRMRALQLQEAYPTSLDDDTAVLAAGCADPMLAAAIRSRMGKKALLAVFLKQLEQELL